MLLEVRSQCLVGLPSLDVKKQAGVQDHSSPFVSNQFINKKGALYVASAGNSIKKKNLTTNMTQMLTVPLRASQKKSQITLFFKHSSIKQLPHASSPPPHPPPCQELKKKKILIHGSLDPWTESCLSRLSSHWPLSAVFPLCPDLISQFVDENPETSSVSITTRT